MQKYIYIFEILLHESIIDDSVTTCDEIIDTTKNVLTKTVPAKSNSKNFYILLHVC